MNERTVRVGLLGPVDVLVGDLPRPLSGLRRKSVLAVLALHPGQVISASRLIDLVWGDDPPATAVNTLQRHISYLRRVLRARDAIIARAPGYLLDMPAEAVDVGQAKRLLDASANADDHVDRAARLSAALRMWRGPSLADVAEVSWLRDQGRQLDEARLAAMERLVEARLALGEHAALVAELDDLIAKYPFREHLHQLLMLALYRCGRQADALSVYQRLRQVLASELGIDPSPALRDLETAILRQDPGLDLRSPVVSTAPTQSLPITPAQLPRALTAFAGRDRELAWLRSHLDAAAEDDPTRPEAPTIVVVSGTAGVGKTSLVVQWAHQVKPQFPDGQLYVDLRGFDVNRSAMDPGEALRGFLGALGIPRYQIPVSPQAQAGLYRSLLAGKRLLIVADNAREEEQVRPLLPGTSGQLVVVTSRHPLPGLVAADGAHGLILDRPSVAEARQLLARRLGAWRIDAERQAADDIVARCARLPLALAVAAARAAQDPNLPIAELAAQLRDASTTLDSFGSTDPATNLRAVFSCSYDMLSEPAARLFRLLGLCPGPDLALPAAASLAGRPASEVEPLLAELVRAQLLTETSPGRFGFHELLGAYATEQAHRHDTAEQQAAARHRLLDHYLHSAYAGASIIRPARDQLQLAGPIPGVAPERPADLDEAMAWFKAEYDVLLAVVGRQCDGFDRHTWQLAWVLGPFLCTHGYWRDNELVQRTALLAAHRLGDREGQAHAHRALGKVQMSLGDLDRAEYHNRIALELFEEVGDRAAVTVVHLNLAFIAERRGDPRQALDHADRAYRYYQSIGHATGQACAANAIGWYRGRLGNHRSGLAYCHEALVIYSRVNDLEGAAASWDSLGALHFGTGELQRGEECFRHAITLYRRLGDRSAVAATYANLADGQDRAGNSDAAQDAWRQALAILDDIDPKAADELRTRLDAVPAS